MSLGAPAARFSRYVILMDGLVAVLGLLLIFVGGSYVLFRSPGPQARFRRTREEIAGAIPSRQRRACDRMPTTPVADTVDGPARIHGVVVALETPTEAPFTRLPVCAHVTRIDLLEALYPPGPTLCDAQPFLLQDGSGVAMVLVAGDTLELAADEEERVVEDLAALSRLAPDEPSPRGSFRQKRLQPGDEVVLYGQARWEAGTTANGGGSYREPPHQLVLRPIDGKLLVRRVVRDQSA